MPVTDLRNRASANPNIEAIEGVNVQVHLYDAEAGRTGGGTFNVATKSGSNNWHGSGFYQARPRWGTANNFFSEQQGVPLPETYFHLGGGGLGGPIAQEPHVLLGIGGRLRLEHDAQRAETACRPRARKPATFRGASTRQRRHRRVIYDPLTGDANGNGRTPFPGNVIPADRLNAVGVKMLSYLPNAD